VGRRFFLRHSGLFPERRPAGGYVSYDRKVKDNLCIIIGDGGNVAVCVTDEGVILVDG
jgi:hypothetical protein